MTIACSNATGADPSDLVGTWKFVSYLRTDPGTGKNTNVMGEHRNGYLIYTPEGRMMVIVVDPERLREASERITGRRDLPTFSFEIRDEATVKLFLAAHRMMERRERFEAARALTAFLGDLIARHAGSRGWRRGAASHASLRLACDYIEAHLTESISLESLAAAAGISKYYLVRQFTQAFGLPPHTYQIRLRIARARELLARARVVKRVSAELGFADQSHFGRHFRKATCLTPAEYQRRVTGRAGPEVPMEYSARSGYG